MSPRSKSPDDDTAQTSIYESRPPKLQTISMKTPPKADEVPADTSKTPALQRPNLHSRAEIQIPQNLGYLAPPADPRRARARRTRDIAIVVSLSIIVASIIAIVIWFAAR